LDVLTKQEKDQLFSKIGKSAARLLFPAVRSGTSGPRGPNTVDQSSEMGAEKAVLKDLAVVVPDQVTAASVLPTAPPLTIKGKLLCNIS
jgi:hypothetical protein